MNGKRAVWGRVEEFRLKYLTDKADLLPLDVFTLAEIELKLDVIPFDDLFNKFGVDAALMQDFSGLYVDKEAYIIWEQGPVWKQHRLRFSVAHEIGHYFLHRDIAKEQKFNEFGEFFRWIRSSQGMKFNLEQTANEFAGRLLVPKTRLEDHLSQMIDRFESVMPDWRGSADLQKSFCQRINNNYGVNADVIRIRLEREELWIIS
jgi:Zn-dependent peptidase ImmA (M78 family)